MQTEVHMAERKEVRAILKNYHKKYNLQFGKMSLLAIDDRDKVSKMYLKPDFIRIH